MNQYLSMTNFYKNYKLNYKFQYDIIIMFYYTFKINC